MLRRSHAPSHSTGGFSKIHYCIDPFKCDTRVKECRLTQKRRLHSAKGEKETKATAATMAEHEDTLASFMGITGASSTTATQYLEITNWMLEEAVNLFMESGGHGVGGGAALPPAPSSAAAASAYDDDVRAPDPSKRQRLFGDAYDSMPIRRLHEQYRDFAAESIAVINAASRAPAISSAFVGEQADDANRTRDLSSLFQPPVELMFKGTYSEARALAKNSGKWLLVNIQDEIVFASHMLNRDTWADDVVQNVVASGYVFWQNYWVSENGKKFCTLYQIERESLPLVAIMNPKTGEIVQKYTGFIDPQEMTERLSDFFFSQPAQAEELNGAGTSGSQARDITEASEEEQLAAAIAASMEGADDSDVCGQSEDEFDEAEEKAVEPEEKLEAMPEEPAAGTPNVTRVQIRTPDGSRLTHRFVKSDPISLVWRFIKDQVPEARTRAFELRTAFPPAAVAFHEVDTIADRKLENASLMVKWL